MTPGRDQDKLIDKPVTPISLSYAKKTMLEEAGQGTELMAGKQVSGDGGPNRDFPSDYNFQQETASMQKVGGIGTDKR